MKVIRELIEIASQDFGGMLVIILVVGAPIYGVYRLVAYLGGWNP